MDGVWPQTGLDAPHSEKALAGLKFSAALPERLAHATLAARLADVGSAAAVLREPACFVHL
ncbi:hypothetical protein D0Q02_12440 [Micromonospora craniellae]|uniref:Uncharacterized protein n=1 Tax=Micromonospora craniellae TaxID=2294034 RepID=A0A372G0J1_9ACTN|nr:hypothetical protein D0Q02_12440 [Micromonospora craniellae]